MNDWEISLTRYCLTEISRLQAIVAAQREIIYWYEEEGERSCHEDSEIPEELRQLEQALGAAKSGRR